MAKQAPATDMGRDIVLEIVLEAFSKPPFEPLEEVSDPALTLKTVFLLAISSLKRVGDIQALSVAFLLGLCTWDGQSLPLAPDRGTCLKCPPPSHGRLYCRPSALLPSRTQTSRRLTVCVQSKHLSFLRIL